MHRPPTPPIHSAQQQQQQGESPLYPPNQRHHQEPEGEGTVPYHQTPNTNSGIMMMPAPSSEPPWRQQQYQEQQQQQLSMQQRQHPPMHPMIQPNVQPNMMMPPPQPNSMHHASMQPPPMGMLWYVPEATGSSSGLAPVRQPRRYRTVRRVPLVKGNLVLDCPVPVQYLNSVPMRDRKEFTHMRYTAVTSDPADFANAYTLRQDLMDRNAELFICITMYNVRMRTQSPIFPVILTRALHVRIFRKMKSC